MTVTERDLRALLGIVSDGRDDLGAAGLPLSMLADLTGQIRCDVVAFQDIDSGRRLIGFSQEIPDFRGGDEQAYWDTYDDCDACAYPGRGGDLRAVTMISDFYSALRHHGTGHYQEFQRPYGLEHKLTVYLPAGPGPATRTGTGRSLQLAFLRERGPDFSERDRALLALLRPHLHQAYLDAVRRRHATPALTGRHREILRLVAAGCTNAQIGRKLGISEATVRNHLSTIYGRLGVSSRTAAVTRAFPILPLSDGGWPPADS